MAAQTRRIIVTVADDSCNPLANSAVTLMGGNTPQALATDESGRCTFSDLPPGTYRLVVVREGFNAKAISVTLTDTADAQVKVTMKVVEEETAGGRSKIFQILTVVQYVFLGILAAALAYPLYRVFGYASLDLKDIDNARGMITFVVSFGTIAIALILVMSAAFLSGSKDLDRRFAFGKDVFTVLVGVLGTIVGFYYGQSAATGGQTRPGQTLQISAAQLNNPTPNLGTEITLTATITGGTAPYKYTVTFDPANAIQNPPTFPADSADGNINQKFTLSSERDLGGKPVTYKITAEDSKGVTGLYDEGNFTPAAAASPPPGP